MDPSQRVMLLDEAPQPLLVDMGIDVRGRNVVVAEQLLHRSQIGAPLQQVAGKGMAQHMWRDPAGVDPGGECERLQLLTEALAGEMPAAGGREEPGRRAFPARFILADRGEMGAKGI